MTGTIVVAMTLTDSGRRALAWAAARAEARKQNLEILTVVGGAMGVVGEREYLDAASEAAEALLEHEAAPLRERGLAVEIDVRRGNPLTHITEASNEADLLVIGSDYGDGSRRRGTHGIRIVAASACPTVVVGATDPAGRSGVVVGVDGSPTSAAALAFAAAEADRLGETLHVVSVWTPIEVPSLPLLDAGDYRASMQEATEEVQAIALAGLGQDYPDLVIEREVVSGYPSHVLADRAESASLTVVGSRGRGAIARFLLGSISHEVLISLNSVTAVVR